MRFGALQEDMPSVTANAFAELREAEAKSVADIVALAACVQVASAEVDEAAGVVHHPGVVQEKPRCEVAVEGLWAKRDGLEANPHLLIDSSAQGQAFELGWFAAGALRG